MDVFCVYVVYVGVEYVQEGVWCINGVVFECFFDVFWLVGGVGGVQYVVVGDFVCDWCGWLCCGFFVIGVEVWQWFVYYVEDWFVGCVFDQVFDLVGVFWCCDYDFGVVIGDDVCDFVLFQVVVDGGVIQFVVLCGLVQFYEGEVIFY